MLNHLDKDSKMIALGIIKKGTSGYHLKLQRNIKFPTGTIVLSLKGIHEDLLKIHLNKEAVVFYSTPYHEIISCVVYEGQNKELINSFYEIQK